MPFIPPDFVETLRQQLDLASVIGQRVPLKGHAGHHLGLCPFHAEKTPSFHVYAHANPPHYHCFGCGAHGDVVSFIMAYEYCSFPEAVARLAERAGLTLPAEEETPQQRQKREQEQRLLTLLHRAEDFFASQRPKVAEYLQQRQIQPETAARYALGFASGNEPLEKILAASSAELQAIGLVSRGERGLYARFRNRLLFPIRQRHGKTVGFGGRALSPEQQPKYLNSAESQLFQKQSLFYGLWEAKSRKTPRYIVVEGYLDVLQLSQHGFPEAVAVMGTALSAEGLRQLLASSSGVYFCLDGDVAGKKAILRALPKLLPSLRDTDQLYFVELPENLDPDDFLKKYGSAAFAELVAAAPLFPEYFFRQLRKNFDLKNISGRIAALNYAKPLLASLKAPLLRQEMQAQLQREIRQLPPMARPPAKPAAAMSATTVTPARLALGLLLRYPQLLAKRQLNPQLHAYFEGGAAVFFELQTWLQNNFPDLEQIDKAVFAAYWQTHPQAIHLQKLPALLEKRLEYQSIDLAAVSWSDCLQCLERDSLKQQLHQLRQQQLAVDDPRLQHLLALLQRQ
jgi:DNA primase